VNVRRDGSTPGYQRDDDVESIPPEQRAERRRRQGRSTAADTSARTVRGHSSSEQDRAGPGSAKARLEPPPSHEQVARRQLLDAGEAGAAGDVLERQVGVELRGVDLAPEARELQQRLDLGREGERAVVEERVHERLLADVVAGEDQPLSRRVPERDREHPGQAVRESEAVLLVQVRNDRCVAGAAHVVAGQLGAQPRSRRARR
jgi:hypothetical protein